MLTIIALAPSFQAILVFFERDLYNDGFCKYFVKTKILKTKNLMKTNESIYMLYALQAPYHNGSTTLFRLAVLYACIRKYMY